MLKSNAILVTGGAGFIGSHTCKLIASAGFEPVVIDNLSTGFKHNVRWGSLHVGDLRNKKFLVEIFKNYNFSGIIHFASKAYVGESMSNPLDYFNNNLISTINLLEIACENNVDKIVFSSSCATYGEALQPNINEFHSLNPISPYGYTKMVNEKLLNYLSASSCLSYVALRYFNAAGADLQTELGEEHENETHVIPNLVRAALRNESFIVFGNQFNTSDGTAIRDYVHVHDLARAHLMALEYLLSGGKSIEINLGSSRATSVLDLILNLNKLGYKINYNFREARAGDPPSLIADNSLAKDKLRWEPIYSSINQILESVIKWELQARI